MTPTTLYVREKPPLGLHATVQTPDGRNFRWGQDDVFHPENIPSNLTFSTTMPGGFDKANCDLNRFLDRDYPDLVELSTIQFRGAGGQIAWEGRVENIPSQSGNPSTMTAGLVGWQAHLTDFQSVQEIYVNQDVTTWGDPPLAEQLRLAAAGLSTADFSWGQQSAGGGLACVFPNSAVGNHSTAEVWFIAPAGVLIAKAIYIGADTGMPSGWGGKFWEATTEAGGGLTNDAVTMDGALHTLTPSALQRWVFLEVDSLGAGGAETPAPGAQRVFSSMALYGNHDLTTYPIDSATPDGLLASDIVAHALTTWAPLLNFSTGSLGTLQDSTFVIPHLIFTNLPATVADVVTGATQYELQDWAVWENRTFYMNTRGAVGKNWRARTWPSQLAQTGAQISRVWNQAVVQYTDTGGVQRTVGPPGSGADTEDATLVDTDPSNPANNIPGLARNEALSMGTSTAAGAIKVGAYFLQEQKLLDTSGSATFTGFVDDDHGVTWPAWAVRAGDNVSFVNAADTGYRRVVSTAWDDQSKTNNVQLDAPPDGLTALLDRLSVVLIPYGLS